MSALSPEQVEELILGNELLNNDPYTKMVMENGFVVTVAGVRKELNPGVFASLRLSVLEQMRATANLERGRKYARELEAAMVIHSRD